MNKKTTYLSGIIAVAIIGCIIQYFVCCVPCQLAKAEEAERVKTVKVEKKAPVIKKPTYSAFNIIDAKNGIKFSSDINYDFKFSEFDFADTTYLKFDNEIERLATYLNHNPNKQLNITGYYTGGEFNNSVFPNLGYARANSIKNHLVEKGVKSKSMDLAGKFNQEIIPDKRNILNGPIDFEMITIEEGYSNLAEMNALKDKINADPLLMYFNSGSSKIVLSKTQRQKMADMLRYVEHVDNHNILVIGHTDNTGTREGNIKLSKSRADIVMNYLVSNGINKELIIASSKGPDQPLAPNDTDEGKAKNRRVEITLK